MIKKIICLFAFISCFSLQNVQAQEIMLPLVYEKGIELTDWLMSEKLDGVRGYWDGKKLLSKNGIPFNPPRSFTKNFPDFEVEGELWGGRGTFEKTVSIVMQKDAHIGWQELKFAIFDVPKASGGFEDRLNVAKMWFGRHPTEFAFVIEHKPITSAAYLQNELKMIEEVGGEGIILRKSRSPYIPGRSKDILKLKSYSDMEAVVVGHLGGEGRNAGRLGSLLVELPHDKTRFKIGTGFSDAVRVNPPPVGTVITFKYYGFYKSGIPKFPSYLHENFN
jgi:DNA ligase-1